MEKINNLSIPAAILLGALILGGFYYFTQAGKQGSIERQQQAEIQAKAAAEAEERLGKSSCVLEAENAAVQQYKETCTYDCRDGYYLTANYDSYYKACLQRKGLD